MKNINLAAVFAAAVFSLAALAVPSASFAQGRYSTQYSKAQVGQIISNLESSSKKFKQDFDRAMDRSPYNGTRDEDRFNGYIKDFDKEVVELRREYNRKNNWWDIRDEVEDVIEEAGPVNNMMNTISFRRNLESQWNRLRNDINKLADTFDMRGINGGGWTGGPWNPGNPGGGNWNAVKPPSWAVGTFYGTAPNGTRIVLSIQSSGQVTAQMNYTNISRGVYTRGNMMVIDGNSSKVEKTRNGIRTVRTSNRETINYTKNNSGGGWDNGGAVGNPPSWAIGRFTGRNPQNGQQITLNIDRNGRVTVNMSGNVSYGVLNGNTFTLNGETSTLTRTRNGFTTVARRNGERITYSKN
jgi:hypothetical protein